MLKKLRLKTKMQRMKRSNIYYDAMTTSGFSKMVNENVVQKYYHTYFAFSFDE
jgi:hypothetical protein